MYSTLLFKLAGTYTTMSLTEGPVTSVGEQEQ